MTKVISDAQKQLIKVTLPSSVTIGSNTYTASKLWSNQKITSYPTITCNVTNDGYDTETEDVVDGILYYSCNLTIHILVAQQTGKDSGARIAEAFAQAIITTISGWTTPLTGDVRIFDPRLDIGSVGFLGYDAEVFDYVLTVTLYHS
jgi:hypothetical protein